MFDQNEAISIEKGANQAEKAPFNWKSLPIDLLIKYHDEIRQHLPPLSLAEINLEEEMLLQYHTLRALQNDVLNDEKIALNQRAQVANTVASALGKLSDRQTETYTQERHKKIEAVLIRVLVKLPEETAAAFLKEYEKILEAS